MHATGLPPGSIISLAIGAMALNPDNTPFPQQGGKYCFFFHVQHLNRRFKCWPLHVRPTQSGQATVEIKTALAKCRDVLTQHQLGVWYICSDGDRGYDAKHREFFTQWIYLYRTQGLMAVVTWLADQKGIPVSDFLHIWKNFCNKCKNHPVTLKPDSVDHWVSALQLEELLQLGAPLTDSSSIGKMRDSYALKLFSLAGCSNCADAERILDLMYLIPWALQEEVVRSPTLSQEQRLMKAMMSFRLLFHYYELSSLPPAPGVAKRYAAGKRCVTFAEDSSWPRLLNNAVALIHFVMMGDRHWSFSRLGTHCLENFFGMVRRCSHGDDRGVIARRVIARATLVTEVMHELGM
jgi:hypothetical protein